MRHLGSLLAGLVAAPLAWVLIAAGQGRTEQTFTRWNDADSVFTGDLLAPVGLAAAGGVLIGLIGCLRWSPVGPVVAGVLFLAGYGVALVRPFELLDALPEWRIGGTRVDLAVPLTNGTLAVLGAALLMAAASRDRWRRWPAAVPAARVGPVEPGAEVPAAEPEPQPPASYEPPTPVPSGGKPDTAEDLPRLGRQPDPTVYIPGPRHAAPDDAPGGQAEPPAQRSPIEPTFQYGPPAPEPDAAQSEPDAEKPAPGQDEKNEEANKPDEPAPPRAGGAPPDAPPFSSPWAGPPRPPQE